MKPTKKFRSQICCDTTDIKLISKLTSNSLIKVLNTNPSLMRAAFQNNFPLFYHF